ncbi:MAG: LPS assembly lipoprotein LptE [Salaquimonas sp.]
MAPFKNNLFTAGFVLMMLGMGGCQFQPLYSTDSGTIGTSNKQLSSLYVAEVDTREAQQVRNHLIYLLSGGSSPLNPTHEVKLRISSNVKTLAAGVRSAATNQIGNTAGSVDVNASYEIYNKATNELVARGNRETSAAFDKTSQSFATERAERDAQNRAAREVAEQLRLAIASDLSKV